MSGPIRPCLVLNDFNGGGAERLVKDLAIELNELDDIDPVVVVSNGRGELKADFETSDVDLSVLGVDVSVDSVLEGTLTLTSRLRELNVDVVHSHLAFSDLISRLACTRLALPHVSTYHNVEAKRSLVKQFVERTTRHLSDQIVCVSDGVRQSYGNAGRMSVIYNAIDVESFSARVAEADRTEVPVHVRSAETVYLNIGRCVDVKRQWDLVIAMDNLRGSDAHLVIVGDGPLRPKLEELVSRKHLSDRVTVAGYVDSVAAYYAVADAFVSASSKEGLPTTHIEAMASKLPIVSTDIPGVREIVEHGVNGYLCPVSDPKLLAEYMERIGRTGSKSFGEEGFKLVESRFSMENATRGYEKLYRDLTPDC